MHEIDLDAFARLAGSAWIVLVTLVTVTLGILALLLPFFVWRILAWTRITAERTMQISAQLDQVLTFMASRHPPSSKEMNGDFSFSADGEEKTAGGLQEPDSRPIPEKAPLEDRREKRRDP